MKKTVAIILVMLTVVFCLLAFVACNNDDGNNKISVGAVSKMTYVSVESAVKGFLKEEISGIAFTATYVDYIKILDLSQDEIKKLTIDDEYKSGIVSVEKGQVRYSVQYSEMSVKRNLYIIVYNTGECRYICPNVEIGETLTSSYFKSLLNANNYLNSTFVIDESITPIDDSIESKIENKSVYKFTDNAYYDSFSYSIGGIADGGRTNYGYFEADKIFYYKIYDDDSQFKCTEDCNKLDFVLEKTELIDDNFDDFDLNYFDHSYFEKTATGFYSREDILDFNDEDVLPSYVVAVEDSVISQIMATYEYNYGIYILKCKITDIGSTKIDLPKDFLDKIQLVK
ncbi:MAG: hypothetical protein HDT29_03990 [Clostridiales bacterium]|nr:hypothetical protein [Clostridiales bacterium]